MKQKYFIVSFFLISISISFAQENDQEISDSKLKAMIGTTVPNFVLQNSDWEDVSLSKVSGKVVLVDFWASWCHYCRIINKENSLLYEIYHQLGFEIVSVSLDTDYYKWKRASEMDQIVWPNVIDSKGMDSEVAKLFNINHTPTTFLLDSNRVVIAIDMEGDELEEKIKELLK